MTVAVKVEKRSVSLVLQCQAASNKLSFAAVMLCSSSVLHFASSFVFCFLFP